MPNYCDNTLGISGTPEVISELRAKLRTAPDQLLDFNAIFPPPPELQAQAKNGEYREVNNWCIANWGTRSNAWFCDDELVEYSDTHHVIQYIFSTAWSPALGVVRELIKQYPSLHIAYVYSESGNDFSGFLDYDPEQGITENDEGEYGEFHGTREEYL